MKPRSIRHHPHLTSRTCVLIATLTIYFPGPARAQWEIVTPAPTTGNLRGIHSIGAGIAWVSGTEGTVLRTTDDGKTWQPCATTPATAATGEPSTPVPMNPQTPTATGTPFHSLSS